MSSDQPTPPSELPAYVVDPIKRQDRESLELIQQYVEELLAYYRAIEKEELEEDELADADEELVDVEETGEGTIVTKLQQCGKNCGGCPHGPYKWRVTRDGDSLNWEFIGRAD